MCHRLQVKPAFFKLSLEATSSSRGCQWDATGPSHPLPSLRVEGRPPKQACSLRRLRADLLLSAAQKEQEAQKVLLGLPHLLPSGPPQPYPMGRSRPFSLKCGVEASTPWRRLCRGKPHTESVAERQQGLSGAVGPSARLCAKASGRMGQRKGWRTSERLANWGTCQRTGWRTSERLANGPATGLAKGLAKGLASGRRGWRGTEKCAGERGCGCPGSTAVPSLALGLAY